MSPYLETYKTVTFKEREQRRCGERERARHWGLQDSRRTADEMTVQICDQPVAQLQPEF